jgi:hypothetical protein
MALVDHDEIEEVRWVLAEVGRGFAVPRRSAHESLEDGEEQAAVLRNSPFLANVARFDAHHRVFGKRGKSVVRLVGENVAVSEKQDARTPRRLAAQIPPAVKQLPRNLKCDERLARASRQRQQNARFFGGDLIASKPAGVWLWFSRFDERLATKEQLIALRWWVEKLSPEMAVFNLHGGYFSMALSKVGMSGIAHGIGYGEQKDVVPVIGQSTPTVQYYVRSLHGKYSVALITRCFSSLGIKTRADFLAKICDCVICQGIVGNDLSGFAQFGEIRYSTPSSKRAAQTPAAAKRCRFHFLLNRIKERDQIKKLSLAEIAAECTAAHATWSKTLVSRGSDHLQTWAEVLQP